MTSVLRSWGQLVPTERLMVAVASFTNPATSSDVHFDASCCGFPQPAAPNGFAEGTIPVTDLSGIDTTLTVTALDLYRDLGQELVVTDTSGNHDMRFRLGAQITAAGAPYEGYSVAPNTWLKTWSSSGKHVVFARTG